MANVCRHPCGKQVSVSKVEKHTESLAGPAGRHRDMENPQLSSRCFHHALARAFGTSLRSGACLHRHDPRGEALEERIVCYRARRPVAVWIPFIGNPV